MSRMAIFLIKFTWVVYLTIKARPAAGFFIPVHSAYAMESFQEGMVFKRFIF